MSTDAKTLTQLLRAWSEGRSEALDELFAIVHSELRRQARRAFRHERPGHTLQPTALVNEVYLKLRRQLGPSFQDRAHFFQFAALVMRWILVDHSRERHAGRRFPPELREPLGEDIPGDDRHQIDLVVLDQALSRLEALDKRQARIVELRYFAGMSVEETAAILEISPATVKREFKTAKAWLRSELSRS